MEQPDDHVPSPSATGEPDPATPEPGGPPIPGSAGTPDAPSAPDAQADLAAVRELILLAYPDVVPELIQGGTLAELQASVAPARAVYRQVAERIAAGAGATSPAPPPAVPAGAASGGPPIDGLPPGELIKRGLQRRG